MFYSLVEQHGCAEESLEQSVVQFVRDARTLPGPFFQADIVFEVGLPLGCQPNSSLERCSRSPAVPSRESGIRAAPRETIGVDCANLRRSADIGDRMSE